MWSFSGKWDERMSRGVLLPEARFTYSKAFCGSVESKVYRRKRRTTFHVRGNMWILIQGSLNEENRWTLHIAVFRNRRWKTWPLILPLKHENALCSEGSLVQPRVLMHVILEFSRVLFCLLWLGLLFALFTRSMKRYKWRRGRAVWSILWQVLLKKTRTEIFIQ